MSFHRVIDLFSRDIVLGTQKERIRVYLCLEEGVLASPAEMSCRRWTGQSTCSFDCKTRMTHHIRAAVWAGVGSAEGVTSREHRS